MTVLTFIKQDPWNLKICYYSSEKQKTTEKDYGVLSLKYQHWERAPGVLTPSIIAEQFLNDNNENE